MKSCKNCGQKIQDLYKHCPFCGELQSINEDNNVNILNGKDEKKSRWVKVFFAVVIILIIGRYTYVKNIAAQQEAIAAAAAKAAEEARLQALREEQVRQEQKRIEESKGYEAILSCGLSYESHINILPCFLKTELEIQTDGKYALYKIGNIVRFHQEHDGLHIKLTHHFSIKAQNSHESLLMNLKIIDSNGKVVFQKSAGQYGVIYVSN